MVVVERGGVHSGEAVAIATAHGGGVIGSAVVLWRVLWRVFGCGLVHRRRTGEGHPQGNGDWRMRTTQAAFPGAYLAKPHFSSEAFVDLTCQTRKKGRFFRGNRGFRCR